LIFRTFKTKHCPFNWTDSKIDCSSCWKQNSKNRVLKPNQKTREQSKTTTKRNSRVVELVLEWGALLYGESVGLTGELVTHHLQVAVRQRLVPDIRRIS
jgi:hypothetical protein